MSLKAAVQHGMCLKNDKKKVGDPCSSMNIGISEQKNKIDLEFGFNRQRRIHNLEL